MLAGPETNGDLSLYCVDCEFAGSATILGEIDVNIALAKVNKVQVGINADFSADLNLGIEASAKIQRSFEQQLTRVGLSGFTVNGLVVVGPYVSISVAAHAGIQASGEILLGTTAKWNDVKVVLDALDIKKSSGSAPTPTFGPRAQASGEIGVEASLGLPLQLGVGIDVLNGVFSADVALEDEPSITATAGFKGAVNVSTAGLESEPSDKSCLGVSWGIGFKNTFQGVMKVSLLGRDEVDVIPPQVVNPVKTGCISYLKGDTQA